MEIGDLISLYRKQAGLTIEELSEAAGVPKGTLNKIIGGITKAPTLDNMKAIARAMGKTLADFDDLPSKPKTALFHSSIEARIIEKLPKLKENQLESIEKRIDTYIDDNEVEAREVFFQPSKKAT